MARPEPPKCHPCRAKGMKQINYFIAPERKNKFHRYCQMKGVSMTSLLNSLTARELEENYEGVLKRHNRQQLHRRAKAYSYLRNRNHRS